MDSTFKTLQNPQQRLRPAGKKNGARRGLSLALALAMVVSLGGMAPLAESDATQGDLLPTVESDASQMEAPPLAESGDPQGEAPLLAESGDPQDGLPSETAGDQPDRGQEAQEGAPTVQPDAPQADSAGLQADPAAPAGQPGAPQADPDAPTDQADASQADPAIGGPVREEAPMHAHAESCIAERPVLACIEEHEHADGCYQMQSALVCGLEEAALEQPGIQQPEIQQPGTQEIAPLSAPAPVLPRGPRSVGDFYTVTFYDGTESGDPPTTFYYQVQVLEGDTCPMPGTPQIPLGYSRFIGWFVDGAVAPFDFTAPVMANIALHARYAQVDDVQVTFKNGQNVAIGCVILASGELLAAPGDAITSGVRPVGHQIFTGQWYDEALGSTSAPFVFGASVTTDIVLAPAFVDGVIVSFNTQGSYEPPQLVLAGSAISRPSVDPTRTGFTFTGWSESPDGAAGPFGFDSTYITADRTIYAQWTGNPVGYSVAYWVEKPGGTVDDMLTDEQKNDTSRYSPLFMVEKMGAAGDIVSVASADAMADLYGYGDLPGETAKGALYWRSDAAAIAGGGGTVINVYFIRKIYTFHKMVDKMI